ncbi:oligosaccharide flippase family protein [Parvularcula sp. ZS-1/3]|uniref:Oligosaccharide flippase family protein n=1 Tax=Parvularcula mediterranea TaxID=2732508 RepID=A0A7Y3W6J6_9PROT|nr:oligosaccharide flippase family protein [Parvularcula mediterranea]NNU17346.1 oligosaccharide flippase family protein [Parvularcula mediterranea]
MIEAVRMRAGRLRDLLLPSQTMRAAGSVAGLTFLELSTTTVMKLASNLILARLVVPEAFGLIAVAMTINVAMTMMSDIGLRSSVIRSPNGAEPDFLRTVWTLNAIKGFLLSAFVVGLAYALTLDGPRSLIPEASILADPAAPAVITVTGITLFFGNLKSANDLRLERHQNVLRNVLLAIAVQVAATVTTLVAAFQGLDVWAFVLGVVVGSSCQTILSHIVLPGPRMGFHLDMAHVKEIISFGKWLFLSTFLLLILQRGDIFFFAGTFDAQTFALYSVAIIWSKAAFNVFSRLLNKACFPAFSAASRVSHEEMRKTYRKLRLIVDAVIVATVIGVFFCAEFAFEIMYPEKFHPAGGYLKILILGFLFLPFNLIQMCELAMGKSRKLFIVQLAGATYTVVALPIAYALGGPLATMAAFAGRFGVNAIIAVWRASPVIGIRWQDEIRLPILFAVFLLFAFTS